VLELLEKYHAKAAFFCIGEHVAQHPEITKAAYEKKHIIANHSYTHSNFFDFYSPSRMAVELEKTNEIIYRTTGKRPRLFRPPFGVTNPLLKKALKKTGLAPVGWSVRSLDTVKSVAEILERLKKQTHPGAVILLHDMHEKVIPVLEDFLPWLQQNGYQITGLDKMFNIEVYEVD
jgi:peptidoglycan/xylan/chitin deacetylase (PgdA/CDA1 family)